MMNRQVTLIATAAMGLEAVVAREVKQLGYEEVQVDNGKVLFKADPSAIARCNLWLRTADRIKVLVGEFKATTFDELLNRQRRCRGRNTYRKMGSSQSSARVSSQRFTAYPIVSAS